jgi:flagellar hook-length control protein FliK
VAINSNALSINSSIAANSSFQGRSPDSGFGAVNDASGADGDPGAASTNSHAATADSGAAGSGGTTTSSGSTGAAGGTASSQKTGPSAQTRNAQGSRAQGSGHARSRAAGAAPSQSNTVAQDAGDDSSSDFGSVMATALGRSAAAGADGDAPTKTAAGPDDASGTAGTAQVVTAPTDAMAWIAQVLMTPGTAQPPNGASASGTTDPATDGRIGAAGARTGARTSLPTTSGASADDPVEDANADTVAAGNAVATGQTSANAAAANRLKFATDPLPQASAQDPGQATVQTTDAQAAATAAATTPDAANINALAGVQKLISGLTGTDAASGTDGGAAAAPTATHGTAAGSSMDAAQSAAALQASALTRTGAGLGATSLTIQAPVGSSAFADEVSSRVTSLAQSGITQAQLQLNPTDLGPVQVHITMQAGQASVWFGATHSDTRAALEQSLPHLRQMFANAGLPLSDSGVFREPPPQQQAQPLPATGSSRTTAGETAATTSVTQVANVRLSLLDTYA